MSFYGTVPAHCFHCFTGCPFWCLSLPHLQQMSMDSGTFLPFPLDLEGFPLLTPLPPLVEPFPLDLLFPSWILSHTGYSWPWQCPVFCQYVCVWKPSNQAISMTLGKVTSLPFLMIFVWILSGAKALIIVSLNTLFCVSPSGYSAFLTNLRALVWKSSRLMEPWNSLLSSTTAIKAFD